LSLNFFFLAPIGAFTIADPENWVALFAFLITSIAISQLSVKARREAVAAQSRRAEMERLYSFSRAILLSDAARAEAGDSMAGQIARQLVQVFDCPGAAVFDSTSGQVRTAGHENLESEADRMRQTVVHGTLDRSNDTLVFPVTLGGRPIGSVAAKNLELSEPAIDSLANLIAIGLERSRSLQSASRAEAARQSEELKSTLLDAIAHEFKTPLTSIKAAASGLLTLIGRQPASSPEHELASIVEEEADRLNVLVTETIRMARIEAGKVRMERKAVDPEAVVRSALGQLGSRAEDRSVTIHSESSLHAVRLDPELFAIAIRQALDNALKYSAASQPVEVSLREQDQEFLVEIRDHGKGIPINEQAQIFEKFYRGASSGSHVAGSGMGLAIAREIVELHGGRAWIESAPGKGTSFFAAIPIGAPMQKEPQAV
jgi:two-component system sensor histidine kinase KdpD